MYFKNFVLCGFLVLCSFAQSNQNLLQGQDYKPFEENIGQWEEPFHHKIKLRWGQIFFFGNRLVVDTWDQHQYIETLECLHHPKDCNAPIKPLKKHAYEIEWLNTSLDISWENEGKSDFYTNYYLGDNPNRWKSEVRNYASITAQKMWEGIDVKYYEKGGYLKYDINVNANADVSQIKFQVNHSKGVSLNGENLLINTSVGAIEELKPYAYQLKNGEEKEIKCSYVVKKNIVTFQFYDDYDPTLALVIDPEIIFSTFSGSIGDNWGTSATYDNAGNAYGGGILFNQTYPTTLGAYQINLAGSSDVAVTKYSPTGTAMLFSTLLGGLRGEIPYSMVVDENDNLIVMGSTGSSNFPATANAYDITFNGGTSTGVWQTTPTSYLASYPEGSDFFVSKFSSNGMQLLASTFVGGSRNEGFNIAAPLNHNYGDNLRGEVLVDENNDIYVIGTTQSNDFPTTNAFQNNFGGGTQDAIVFKLNSNMSSLLWSSFYGGSGEDAGYGLQIGQNGFLYFCGGTTSAGLSGMDGVSTQNHGGVDGFVVRVSSTNGVIENASFIGTNSYDQCFFVQIDALGDVFLFGQTQGNYSIVPPSGQSIYSSPGGSLFFHKLNANLSQTIWSTRFGTNNIANKLVPSAFLVDNCNFISFSIWAGNTNQSTSQGLPVTADAYQSSTDGNDFYLGVFGHDAASLHYGTYFGGAMSSEHVDGGTSRFDKNGIVYQAVCAGCGGLNDMPTTTGAWSSTNNSANCNMAVFKFDVSEYSTIIGEPSQDFICDGAEITFSNLSTGQNTYTWHFGDGNTSNEQSPTHTYAEPGVYEVLLMSNGNSACTFNDTAFLYVEVHEQPLIEFNQLLPICKGDTIQISVSGGTSFQWQPAPGLPLSQINSATPLVNPTETTIYSVTTSNPCGSDSGTIEVSVIPFDINIFSPQLDLCKGDSISVQATDAESYDWQPESIILSNQGNSVLLLPDSSIMVYLTAFNENDCRAKDSLFLNVLGPPIPVSLNDTLICFGESILLSSNSNYNPIWKNLNNNMQFNQSAITVSPDTVTAYEIFLRNQCGQHRDTFKIDVSRVYPIVGPDVSVCNSTPIAVYAEGGTSYFWSPAEDYSSPYEANTILTPQYNKEYSVLVRNEHGCSATATLNVFLYPPSAISAGPDKMIPFGGSTILEGQASIANVSWSPPLNLSCVNCLQPRANPLETRDYTITLTDSFGCKYSDMMKIIVEGTIYVANAFTPNGDGINDRFYAFGVDVEEFLMEIYTRNGELIYMSKDITDGWDGTVNGNEVQMDVYVYVIYYMLNSGEKNRLLGRVTVVH